MVSPEALKLHVKGRLEGLEKMRLKLESEIKDLRKAVPGSNAAKELTWTEHALAACIGRFNELNTIWRMLDP